jgi:hypothetical protein
MLTFTHPNAEDGNIFPPGSANAEDAIGATWSLLLLSTPFLRRPLIALAILGKPDMNAEQRRIFARWWNSEADTTDPLYPNWISLDPGFYVSVVRWNTLEYLGVNPAFNISSWRMCHKGLTIYNNAPDLVNQGMVIATQNQANWKEKAFEHGEETLMDNPMLLTFSGNQIYMMYPDAAGTVATRQNSHLNGSTASWTVVYGFVTRWRTNNTETKVEVPAGETIRFDYSATTNNTGNLVITHVAETDTLLVNVAYQSINATYRYYVDLMLADQNDTMANTVDLPPYNQQSMLQSSPKTVVMLMKEDNGIYLVHRTFQPMFWVQTSANLSPVKIHYEGIPQEDLGSSITGPRDTVDRNFGWGVVLMSRIPTACSPVVKIRMGWELVATDSGPWQSIMYNNQDKLEIALEIIRSFAVHHPYAYPASYNDFGGLLGLITNVLGKIPVIGEIAQVAAPILGQIIGGRAVQAGRMSMLTNRLQSTQNASLSNAEAGMISALNKIKAMRF